MKEFEKIIFDPSKCRKELNQFKTLLDSKKKLKERLDLLPFFRAHEQLTAFLGTYAANIGPADRLAYGFPLFGDFVADIILGNADTEEYCLIELEDADDTSVLKRVKGKATKEWASRFDHGCSQLIDWFYALADLKKTSAFSKHFGHGHIKFYGLLVIGRSKEMSEDDFRRLKWRSEKVIVDSHPLICLTFDGLYDHLLRRIQFFPETAKLEK